MRPGPDACFHLTVEIVRRIHTEVLIRFGGLDGVRDMTLLESAVAAPRATMGGASVFTDITDVAAAYLFYLCRNHPFLDGNKRTALGACLVFLRLNGVEPRPDGPDWETLLVEVASGALGREETAARLGQMVR